jgi:hypothetical protein
VNRRTRRNFHAISTQQGKLTSAIPCARYFSGAFEAGLIRAHYQFLIYNFGRYDSAVIAALQPLFAQVSKTLDLSTAATGY